MGKNTVRNAAVTAKLLTQAAMAAPWGVAITDRQRKGNPVVFVNHAFELVSGHEADEALGKSWRTLLGTNPEREALARVQEAVRQRTHCSVVLQSSRKDGSRFRNELSVAPVLNRSGDVTHLIWLQRDATFQIERDERLVLMIAEKEERFSSYVKNATEAIWRIDFEPPIQLDAPEPQQVREIFENGVFSEANDAAARVYGLSKGVELIGGPLRNFMEPSNPENVEQVVEYVRNHFYMKNSGEQASMSQKTSRYCGRWSSHKKS
jgi:PAS domain S-box-containing protein